MHIWVSKLIIIGSDKGLLHGQHQAIISNNAGILLIKPLGNNFNEMFINIHILSFNQIHFEMSSGKWHPFCLSINVLTINMLVDLGINLLSHNILPGIFSYTMWSVIMAIYGTIFQKGETMYSKTIYRYSPFPKMSRLKVKEVYPHNEISHRFIVWSHSLMYWF